MTTQQYITKLDQRYRLGNATEHTFRGDLQQLIEDLVPDVSATNEPKRQSCGAPDYILTKKDIPVGFIEAKDIGDKDLAGKKKSGNKEQFDRYKASLDNLIFTDYLDFHRYRNGEFITKIVIGELTDSGIVPLPENYRAFENLISDFSVHIGQTIKSPKKLAEMMAGKARLLSDVIGKALTSDVVNQENSTLKEQMHAFKDILIHDITPKGFADVYAQTIAYGMFAARLHDPTLQTFSRQEAAELIPKSNPFLRKLFGYIAGPDIDDRIKWIVDNLAEIFLACNVDEILKNYGKATKMEDPIIHFYETFLSEYDPKLRKSRGVWYTPQPVVNFIVRAVDDILKTEFGLTQGLTDNSKTKIRVNTQTLDKRSSTGYRQTEQEVHKVQILDPATGTGTFLAEVVKHVHKKFVGQEGIWSGYVENHLLPRLNGFELLMASYAMAHLKLDLLLKETGFKPTKNQRTRVYLTNSLEEHHPDTGTLFANWLSTEANEANHIKRDTPVMVVMGNPPYSISSTNKGEWIENLMKDYKRNLTDNNLQPLSDDYIKFLRYGQHFIEKNGEGILAYISNNSFLDGIIHRQMRKNLLETFDKIYIIDLHGNYKKNEKAPDGKKDENVFDIQQGVSINIFIKKTNKKGSEIFRHDLMGSRSFKYNSLLNSSINEINWVQLKPQGKNYRFNKVNYVKETEYNKLVSLGNLFLHNGAGVQTKRDKLFIDFTEKTVENRIKKLLDNNLTDNEVASLNVKNSSSYRLLEKIESSSYDPKFIRTYNYRIFDNRFIYYDKNLLGRAFYNIMKNQIQTNIGLITCKQQSSFDFQHCMVTNQVTDHNSISLQSREASYFFPLYLYNEPSNQQTLEQVQARTPNLNPKILKQIEEKLGLTFVPERAEAGNVCMVDNLEVRDEYKQTFAPIDLLDYIYGVLHSPTYREKYKEFLKIDFPRIPYPEDPQTFWQLVELGSQLRQLHLMESPKTEDYITTYPIDGSNEITKKIGKKDWELFDAGKQLGRIWINDTQYFDKIPLTSWEFYIGGYQPAQKWLKDRKGRMLGYEDILHYQKVIVALTETSMIMKKIDEIEIV